MKRIHLTALAATLAASLTPAMAAAPDWSKVPAAKFTLLYAGASPIEWITKGTEHGGARALKKGESCASCHDDEAADMGKKIVSGQKNEPKPIKGKAGSIPVSVQAAHDGANLYLRFSPGSSRRPAAARRWTRTTPSSWRSCSRTTRCERANLSGCWETCHADARTMPEAKDDKKTKYVADGSLASGKYYDLIQWTSKGGKFDGYVADKRVMEGGKALVDAKGEKKGDDWTVTFTRKLAGARGRRGFGGSGKVVNIGFAIHDDHAIGRYHHVSFGYTLGLDAKADISAAKQ
jgi:hypothetical protein